MPAFGLVDFTHSSSVFSFKFGYAMSRVRYRYLLKLISANLAQTSTIRDWARVKISNVYVTEIKNKYV